MNVTQISATDTMVQVAKYSTSPRPTPLADDSEVDLCTRANGFFLQSRLNVSLPGVERQTAQSVLDLADQTRPYSKTTRGKSESPLTSSKPHGEPACPDPAGGLNLINSQHRYTHVKSSCLRCQCSGSRTTGIEFDPGELNCVPPAASAGAGACSRSGNPNPQDV